MIYRFIGLRHETTEIWSINRNTLKLNSNLNSLVTGRKEMVLASLKRKVQSTSTFSCHMRTLKIPALWLTGAGELNDFDPRARPLSRYVNSLVRFKNLVVGLARAEKWNATLILSVLSAYQVLSLASVRDGPVNLVGGRGGGGGVEECLLSHFFLLQ